MILLFHGSSWSRFAKRRFFRGSLSIVSMGSMRSQPKYYKKNFVMWVQNDGFKSISSNSMDSTRLVGPPEPKFKFVRISLPTDFQFPHTSTGWVAFLYLLTTYLLKYIFHYLFTTTFFTFLGPWEQSSRSKNSDRFYDSA